MITDYLPLNQGRLEILSELYQKSLKLSEISTKVGKSSQAIHNLMKDMENFVYNKQNIYYLNEEFKILFDGILLRVLLERRMGKYFDILSYVKKYYKPKKLILFGSCAKGEMHEKSDIDLYVISDLSEKENFKQMSELSKVFKIDVQIISVNPEIHLTPKDKYSDLYAKILDNIEEGIVVDMNNI